MRLALPRPMPQPRLILSIFLLAQIFDGLLTYAAVGLLQAAGEGNVLLEALMQRAGVGPALVAAKTVAGACGVLLYARSCYGILALLTGLYLLGAITPWLYVFHTL